MECIKNIHSRVKPKLGHLKIRVITMCSLSSSTCFLSDSHFRSWSSKWVRHDSTHRTGVYTQSQYGISALKISTRLWIFVLKTIYFIKSYKRRFWQFRIIELFNENEMTKLLTNFSWIFPEKNFQAFLIIKTRYSRLEKMTSFYNFYF